ncbi:MAG: Flp pilus assembly complex ATPase component TadA [Candidatus Omnitrophica bacterium]|nr:Flp pilus assembly complex ATPase component TadA [Candidatus Omnitrophota bacterium]
MKFLHIFTTILLFLFCSAALFADVIYLKNGQKIEGLIRSQDGDAISIQTAGGVFSYKRSDIDRVEQGSTLSKILAKAQVAEQQNNFFEAVSLYSDALLLAESEEKRAIRTQQENSIRKYIALIEAHNPLERGLDDLRDIETIKQKISDPHLLSLLQNAKLELNQKTAQVHFDEGRRQVLRNNYEEAIRHYNVVLENYPDSPLARNLDQRVTELYFEWGESEFKKSSTNNETARNAFLKVLEATPGHAKALYYLGMMAVDEERFEEAQDFFSQIDQTKLSSIEARRVRVMLSRAERALLPTPTPRPRPVFVPIPTPAPELSMTQKVGAWFTDAWKSIQDLGKSIAKGSTAEVMPKIWTFLKYLLIALAVIIVYWYIPMTILLRDLPNRKIIYYNWRKIINYAGVFGLIFYFFDRWRREEPRKRCPACNRAIDNYELFENYEFNVCPFCEIQIKPPFTLPEIIQNEALVMGRSRSLSENVHDDAQREQMLKFIYLLMVHGKKIRASDIHIEPEEGKLLARFRVDGVLTESIIIEGGLNKLLVSCIKVMCNLNIAEKRLPQDGHFQRVLLGDETNVRVSTIPTRLGEKVVMRLLDKQIAKAPLDRLGMRSEALEQYRASISSSHGLILATGPTGSGKTTLQYASLQFLNDGSKNIVTVEDPIEYELDGINQVQHNTKTGLTFATALRSILRQDPDVIMVGEIRDLETAQIAVNAALTGHLVFSTLHTIDTSTALSRLIDIGVDIKLLSSSIIGIVAQRLVRKLCPHCKKQSSASARELRQLGVEGKILEGQPFYRPRGCSECSNTGYIGRTGIYEMMIPNRDLRSLIEHNATTTEIRDAARQSAGMKTLREEGLLKVIAGVTSLEEILRVTTEDIIAREEEEQPEAPLDADEPAV